MTIGLINNLGKNSGMGRYAFSLFEQIKNKCDIKHVLLNYNDRKIQDAWGGKVLNSFSKVPLIDNKIFFWRRIKHKIPKFAYYHISTQNLSFLNLKPFIITCHDVLPLVKPSSCFELVVRKYLYSGIKNAKKVITISNSSKKDIVKYAKCDPEKVRVIYYGVNREEFKPLKVNQEFYKKYGLSKKEKYVLYVGDEQERKNVDGVLKAFYRLKKEGKLKNTKLLKIGESSSPNYRARILGLIKRLGLEKDVFFVGHVTKDLAKFYSISKVFVFPSFMEGFGLPPLEAMSCGCPVITSNAYSLPEVVGDSAIKVNPYEVNSLAKQINRVLSDDSLAKDLSKKGLGWSKNFTWENNAKKTLEIYKEVGAC